MAWIPIAAAAAGSLLEGAMGSRAAGRQMDFQRDMSNTAYRRAADDIEAAGLNRVLALGNPASTPSGAMQQVPNFGDIATRAFSAKSTIDLQKEQMAQTRADTMLKEANAELIPAQIRQANAASARELSQTAVNIENARLQSAEADKAEVTRSMYKAVGPTVEKVSDTVGKFLGGFSNSITSAKEAETKVKDKVDSWSSGYINDALKLKDMHDKGSEDSKANFRIMLHALDKQKAENEGLWRSNLDRFKELNPEFYNYVIQRRQWK